MGSLLAKYTMLDQNYPTDGESMRIAREVAPLAGPASGTSSEEHATDRNNDSGDDMASALNLGEE